MLSLMSKYLLITPTRQKGRSMNLNAPTQIVFIISLVLAVLALLGAIGISLPVIGGHAIWVALAAYVVLAAGNLMKGL